MNPDFARRRQSRKDFLLRLYEQVDASVSTFVNGFEVAEHIALSTDEATRIIEYLEEKRWIRVDDHRIGIIRITAEGIDQIETSIE